MAHHRILTPQGKRSAFVERLEHRALRRPSHVAMTVLPWADEEPEVIGGVELIALSRRLAQTLEARRVGAQFRVVARVRRPAWLQVLVLACARRGIPLAVIDPAMGRDLLVAAAERLAPSLIVSDEAFHGEPAGVLHLDDLPPGDDERYAAGEALARGPSVEHPLLLLPASDLPAEHGRFVMMSEPALLAAVGALGARHGIREADRVLVLLPPRGAELFLRLAASIVPLGTGAASIVGVEPRDAPAEAFAQGLRAGATVAFLTPRQISRLLAGPRPRGPSSLRLIIAGGGALPAATAAELEAALGAPVALAYGVPEMGAFVASSAPGGAQPGGVGLPLACEVAIDAARLRAGEAGVFLDRRAAGRTRPVASGEAPPVVGEIVVRGPAQMMGYYKSPQQTRERTTAQGYLRTGDVGLLDPEGSLVVLGRLDEVIVRAGVRVAGPAIDAVALAHPAVAEARTVGVPDERLGERLHTACVLWPGAAAAPEELGAWLRERVPPGGAPDDVSVLGQLPRGDGGDVSPAVLRGVVSGELARGIYAGLTRPRFRRAPPSDPAAALRVIDRAVREARPIRFVAHWGAGPRADVREVDRLALDRLRAFAACAAQGHGGGAELILLLADVHGRVNEQPPEHVEAYLGAIRARAGELSDDQVSIRCRLLGELWRERGLDEGAVRAAADAPAFVEEFAALGFSDTLMYQAGRRANGDPVQAARRYYQVCRAESPAIAAAYPDALWLTYADPDHGHLLPLLPRFHLFSYRQGRTNRPWFEDEAI
jgi:acyl-CoA synthetase (AMP-forming)/AMP-acid ligase II